VAAGKDKLWDRVVEELVELEFQPDLPSGIRPVDRPVRIGRRA
jgi:hypothetical protein